MLSFVFFHFNADSPPGAGQGKHNRLLFVSVELHYTSSALLKGESNSDCDASSYCYCFFPPQPCSQGEGPVASPLSGASEPPEATKQTPQWENSPQERTSQCYQLKQQHSHSTSGATANPRANTHCQCKPGEFLKGWDPHVYQHLDYVKTQFKPKCCTHVTLSMYHVMITSSL